jgi:cell surface protein SprA
MGAEYRYQASYNWRAGVLNKPDSVTSQTGEQDIPDSLDFRNTISNSREQNFSGRLDLVKLYNKSKFLKKINTPARPARPTTTTGRPQQPQRPQPQDTVKQTPSALKGLLRLIMSLRSVTGTYTKNEGTILPGFTPSPWLFGMDRDFNAPGWGFILGDQDPNIRFDAASKGWLVQKTTLTTPFVQRKITSLNLRANVEPTSDFRITIDVKKDVASDYQEIFRYDPDNETANEYGYASLSPSRSGSYRISTLMINSSFRSDKDDRESQTFDEFAENLEVIRSRFATITGQPEFDTATQDVLIPAFIAAYTGKDPRTISLSPFPNSPLPNWRIDYSGLSKLGAFRDAFQMVTISHAYSASYAVVNYSTNTSQYGDEGSLNLSNPIEDYNEKYFGVGVNGEPSPVYIISQVMMSEQFAPLFGINIRTKSRVTAKVEYRTKRDLALNISNAQVSELNSKDVAFEIGYTKNNMKLPFKAQGRTIVLKNDVTMRMNLTISDTKTIQRKLDELGTVTNGNINFQLRPNINYALNEKLNIQAYFERTINTPAITSSYPRATTRFGFQVRFNLAQ